MTCHKPGGVIHLSLSDVTIAIHRATTRSLYLLLPASSFGALTEGWVGIQEGCCSTNHALAMVYLGELAAMRWERSERETANSEVGAANGDERVGNQACHRPCLLVEECSRSIPRV